MKVERGVIIVLYKEVRGSRRYAVLERKKNWSGWELPKGHLEKDDFRETVRIELGEEAGISEDQILDISELGEEVSWDYEDDGETRRKVYRAFSCRVKKECLIDTSDNPCDEHERGMFSKFEDAVDLLEYENNKQLLRSFENSLN